MRSRFPHYLTTVNFRMEFPVLFPFRFRLGTLLPTPSLPPPSLPQETSWSHRKNGREVRGKDDVILCVKVCMIAVGFSGMYFP